MRDFPLQQGDHLTRDEFECRYWAMPHVKKAELIDGVVYLPSRTSQTYGRARFNLIGWLGHYAAATPGTQGGAHCSIRLDWQNEPQPNALLMIERGSQVCLSEDDFIVGAPEWIGEVAASSASYDLHSKLEAYRRNDVKEYVIWRVLDSAIDWFILDGEQYARLPCEAGIYRSRVFPGLWLDVQALLAGQLQRVFEVVQQGVASKEHQDFMATLKPK